MSDYRQWWQRSMAPAATAAPLRLSLADHAGSRHPCEACGSALDACRCEPDLDVGDASVPVPL